MGAGIALEFRLRYPEMYQRYLELCEKELIKIGKLWIYKHANGKWVMNIPTKNHWKTPSKIEYLEKGLNKFVSTYKEREIKSIAFPLLGAQHGGIPQVKSIEIMKTYLNKCNLPVEIWLYEKSAKDEFFEKFRGLFQSR